MQLTISNVKPIFIETAFSDNQNTLWFRMLVFILLLGVISYFIYSYNRRIRLQARQQQDELKLESLRGQMNPHFIFNSLNSINYFISQNDRLSANRYIADFARLIRSILGNLSQEYIPLTKELESLMITCNWNTSVLAISLITKLKLMKQFQPKNSWFSPKWCSLSLKMQSGTGCGDWKVAKGL